jgi:Ni/Fe-hydrogenase subunit HybB-like protein
VEKRYTTADIAPVGPLIEPGHTGATINEGVAGVVDRLPHPRHWYIAFALGGFGCAILFTSIAWLIYMGTGIWGINVPVAWGYAIINFVWWIGIGHAGTLISAILLLLRQDWRTAINRFAEAMTIFAVMCAGMFPILHTGRPWVIYFMLPYPNTMALWPQFRSPLLWDVFAVSTYFTISLLFWYVGLIPDFAILRDRARNKVSRVIYGIFSLGWRGSARHWFRYETASLILAGISTPLVVSVHSIVSFDFAVSIMPGWHTTIFPPYFVAGAVYAGFAMVLTFAIPVRRLYNLKDFITVRHLDLMAKVMLATGLVVFYGYLSEAFYSWYSNSEYERFMMWNRMTGPYWWSYWALILCNGVAPQFLWSKFFRTNPYALFSICMFVSVGMWLERYVIVSTSLTREFLPSSWGWYHGTIWDILLFAGTIGFFLFMMMLFIRFLPMIAIFELKHLHHSLHERKENLETLETEAVAK